MLNFNPFVGHLKNFYWNFKYRVFTLNTRSFGVGRERKRKIVKTCHPLIIDSKSEQEAYNLKIQISSNFNLLSSVDSVWSSNHECTQVWHARCYLGEKFANNCNLFELYFWVWLILYFRVMWKSSQCITRSVLQGPNRVYSWSYEIKTSALMYMYNSLGKLGQKRVLRKTGITSGSLLKIIESGVLTH